LKPQKLTTYRVEIPPGTEDGQIIKAFIPDLVMKIATAGQANYFYVKVSRKSFVV